MKYLTNIFLIVIAILSICTAGILVFIFQIFRKPLRKEDLNSYLRGIAIGLDQFGATLIYGTEDWCISSIAYQHYLEGKNKYFMNFINFIFRDPDHCKNSYETESKVFKDLKEEK